MKTYELEILNKHREEYSYMSLYNRLSNTAWKIFNEGACEETIYFMDRGNLILTSDGITSQGTWCVYEESSLLHINYSGSKNGIMYRLAFIVGDILVFQLDYTNKYSIVSSRNNESLAKIGTFSELLPLLFSKIYLDIRNLNIDIDICCTANDKITNVYIPYGIKKLNSYSFKDCKNLTTVVIPETITELGEEVFSGCESLNEVRIPCGVSVIPKSAFEGCWSLREVQCPDSIEIIEKAAFKGCSNLINLELPNRISEIFEDAFSNCSELQSLILPLKLNSISNGLFSYCYKLRELVIPNSVKIIGDRAFEYCRDLKSIYIPKNVGYIGNNPFKACKSLESIIVSEENSVYDSRDDSNAIIITETNTLKHCCFATKIPNSVRKIQSYAYNDIDIEHITINDNIIEIESSAFYNCKKLTSFFIPARYEETVDKIFDLCSNIKIVRFGIISDMDGVDNFRQIYKGFPISYLCDNGINKIWAVTPVVSTTNKLSNLEKEGNYTINVCESIIYEAYIEQNEKVYYVWVVEFNGNHFLLRNLIPLGFPARINREDRCVIIYGDCHKKLSFSIKFVEKYNRDNNKYETTIYERI